MDNASKALIMAGGILITVLVIGVAMYVLASARGVASDSNKEMQASAAESFNRYYESFSSDIRGIDALNIYNKAKDDNSRYTSVRTIEISADSNAMNNMNSADGITNGMTDSYSFSYEKDSDGYISKITLTKK